MTFKNNFDGFQTQIGDLIIQVSEHSISLALKLPISGERRFKKKEVPTDLCNKFLVADHQDPKWSKGIPNTWLKEEWKYTLPVVQKYISCEGRFSIVHCYLMRFLLHLNGSSIMNLPYYLLKSMTKMENKVQTHPKNVAYSLFHQGIIKVLVRKELDKPQTSWEYFLCSLGFEEHEKKSHKTIIVK